MTVIGLASETTAVTETARRLVRARRRGQRELWAQGITCRRRIRAKRRVSLDSSSVMSPGFPARRADARGRGGDVRLHCAQRRADDLRRLRVRTPAHQAERHRRALLERQRHQRALDGQTVLDRRTLDFGRRRIRGVYRITRAAPRPRALRPFRLAPRDPAQPRPHRGLAAIRPSMCPRRQKRLLCDVVSIRGVAEQPPQECPAPPADADRSAH